MRLEWALACRAFGGRGAELDLEGVGVDTFWPADLPADIDFSVVLSLRGSRDEFAEPSPIEAYLLGPNMTRLGDLSFDLGPVEFPGGYPAGWEFRHLHPLAVSLEAESWGQHVLDIYVSTDECAAVFFDVREP